MLVFNPDKSSAQALNNSPDELTGSILGLGLHENKEIDPLSKLVKLKDSDLLAKSPSVFCMVSHIRHIRDQNPTEWIDEKPVKSITSKKFMMRSFNQILSSCGVSSSGFSYNVFREIIRRAGPGDAISIIPDTNLIQSRYTYSSLSKFALTSLMTSSRVIELPAVLCFPGRIEKLSRIHRLLTWSSESKTPLVIASFGFGEEVRRTLEYNISIGKLKGALLIPSEDDDLSHFAIDDFAKLSGSTIFSELPDEFSVESCGSIQTCTVGSTQFMSSCDPDLVIELQNEIDASIKELLLHSTRTIADRRKSMVMGGKLTVEIPGISAVGVTHSADEISAIMSLWSSFITENHFIAPNGLQSYPINTFRNAISYIKETDQSLSNIGVYLRKEA